MQKTSQCEFNGHCSGQVMSTQLIKCKHTEFVQAQPALSGSSNEFERNPAEDCQEVHEVVKRDMKRLFELKFAYLENAVYVRSFFSLVLFLFCCLVLFFI